MGYRHEAIFSNSQWPCYYDGTYIVFFDLKLFVLINRSIKPCKYFPVAYVISHIYIFNFVFLNMHVCLWNNAGFHWDDHIILQVLAIEFILLAIDFVPLANEFILLANEFVPLADEFVALAFEFVTLAWKFLHNKIGSWNEHENKM